MPVGAYGGRRDLMEHLAPLGPVYQAGTLSGNPVAMAAGLATLGILEKENGWARLEALGTQLETGARALLQRQDTPASFARLGSLFWLAMQPGETPRRFDRVAPEAAPRYAALHRAMLERGVYLAPSAYEVGFLSTAHTGDDIARTLTALGEALAEVPR